MGSWWLGVKLMHGSPELALLSVVVCVVCEMWNMMMTERGDAASLAVFETLEASGRVCREVVMPLRLVGVVLPSAAEPAKQHS
jgi:hypothetical protein